MTIVGIDEVGRGCWAGPVVAGAVILDEPITGLKDSKLLSVKQRAMLSETIQRQAVAYSLGWAGPDEVDRSGLTEAVRLAMQRAIQGIHRAYDQIIIDGNYNFLSSLPNTKTLVRADSLVPSVSAASIIAKVARDDYMCQQAAIYPDYGFETHVGYGTVLHRKALQQYGPCGLHRRSYKPIQALLQ